MALWGDTDDANSVPSYLTTAEKGKTFFVDSDEAGVANNQAKGLAAGWVMYEEYGTGRIKSEVLVAMSRTAAEAGDAGYTGNTTIEDATVEDA